MSATTQEPDAWPGSQVELGYRIAQGIAVVYEYAIGVVLGGVLNGQIEHWLAGGQRGDG